uniref:Retrotransposon protein, putative, unclassified n=1 Tax=Oryza sativa subsp. japonica TaxID=39947 RepID=Q2QSA1_ORYSJ|nr:retrotransposon protein, putative, unclassified [Oryza sativa Japonica Group]
MENPSYYFKGVVEGSNVYAKDTVDDLDDKQGQGFMSADELEEIDIGPGDRPRPTFISKNLSPEFRTKLIEFLKEFRDCFAWEYYEMPGLSRSIVEHRLPIKPGVRPRQQPPRRCKANMLEPVKAEIKRLYDAGFIRPCRYAEWVSRIVPVIKKNGKVRVCIDFRDLNKATPKDEYPMPVADQLVDAASGNKILSFMDGNAGYNQIFMAGEDIHKTAFGCPGATGMFEWVVMTFGLKSAGATLEPFTPLLKLKADQQFTWGAEQQKALDNIKEYLSSPPVLIPPQKGIPFRLYLSAAEYEAVLKGLQLLKEVEADTIEIMGDSLLVISQLPGEYECKNDTLMEHIIYRFGLPQTITMDQGSIFVSDEFVQFADIVGIKLLNSSLYYAQANGQAEASNKSLIKLIKQKISDYPRQWHIRLAEALWSYRMVCHGSIQVPTYKLVYGHEAVLPWEVRIGSRRTELQNDLTADEYYNLMADEREDLVQSRLRALAKVTKDKERVARHYNKKVVSKDFSEGELVWKLILPIGTRDSKFSKWSPNWEGPFQFHKVVSKGAYMLQGLDGEVYGRALNGKYLKKYSQVFGLTHDWLILPMHDSRCVYIAFR